MATRRATLRVSASGLQHRLAYASSARCSSSEPHPSESFLSGTNAVYVESMLEEWKADPMNVHASWRAYFKNVEAGAPAGSAFTPPPSIQPGAAGSASYSVSSRSSGGAAAPPGMLVDPSLMDKRTRVLHLVRAHEMRGHEAANLDPLCLASQEMPAELEPSTYGFSEADLDTPLGFGSDEFEPLAGFVRRVQPSTTLRELLQWLRRAYCGTSTLQFLHIGDRERCNWLRDQWETTPGQAVFSREEKLQILDRLTFSTTFEAFADTKFTAVKRFGLDGLETLVPGLKSMVDRSTELGVRNIVLGMAHRGRLNVLANVIRKPLEHIFKEFQGVVQAEDPWLGDFGIAGDVKYHLGTSYDRTYADGRNVHLSLLANPSHLEAVNPVVIGKARAKQRLEGDVQGDHTLPVLLHGDAAFPGQGVVWETMNMMGLQNYSVGGTIHVIVNNQVGFTTNKDDARSTRHCTDMARAFDVPILHVNGDDPEAVTRVFRIASEWRARFHKDVVVDIVGFRKAGHNELDQPSLTQPLMYKAVEKKRKAVETYAEQLVKEGEMSEKDVEDLTARVKGTFETAFKNVPDRLPPYDWLSGRWKGFEGPAHMLPGGITGVDADTLRAIGTAAATLPDGFEPHRNIGKVMKQRMKMMESGEGVDWATAESLAFGTLLAEENHVRLSGQDVQRGTFSHRHAVVVDQKTGEAYAPLAHLAKTGAVEKQAVLSVANSPLSEFAVLGFELGYNMECPHQLTLWEAQFGDFVNGAQVIIDQFISSGEDKWLRMTGLTMLLPHGYDGQGAEHSSCRLERFLQNTMEDESVADVDMDHALQQCNWQVCNITTPANYFHVLRRQVLRKFRKPLIVASPKALLRHRQAVSTVEEMGEGTTFQPVLPDTTDVSAAPEKVRRVVLCSGKIYYELLAARESREIDNVALVRVEQISPFPFADVASAIGAFPSAEVVWCQEEPRNMGAWSHVAPRIESATETHLGEAKRAAYVGRRVSAAPATGYGAVHKAQQDGIIATALGDKQ